MLVLSGSLMREMNYSWQLLNILHQTVCIIIICVSLYLSVFAYIVVEIGMVQDYYEVVEGQKPFVTICAALYHGKLGFDVVVLLKILNCSLVDAGT